MAIMGRPVDEPLAMKRLNIWAEWRDVHHGISPTVREFMMACGLHSTAPAWAALQQMMSLGWIDQLDHARFASRAQYMTDTGYLVLATWRAEEARKQTAGDRHGEPAQASVSAVGRVRGGLGSTPRDGRSGRDGAEHGGRNE